MSLILSDNLKFILSPVSSTLFCLWKQLFVAKSESFCSQVHIFKLGHSFGLWFMMCYWISICVKLMLQGEPVGINNSMAVCRSTSVSSSASGQAVLVSPLSLKLQSPDHLQGTVFFVYLFCCLICLFLFVETWSFIALELHRPAFTSQMLGL